MIRCRNSLTNAMEVLQTARPGILTWYACGPTVYADAHLGHARCYVSQDVLRRILERHGGLRVHLQLGITDIDDKIVRRAAAEGLEVQQLTRRYERRFLEDMRRLGVLLPDRLTRVSDNLPAIIAFVQRLLDAGRAYRVPSGSIYFSIAAYRRLGFRYPVFPAACPSSAFVAGSDMAFEKRDAADFALWRACRDAREPGWPAFGGRGRPGWHIECSAMVHAGLGGSGPDLHTGGIDLRFPHHENEVAQSQADGGRAPWCPLFLHVGHVRVAGEKMAKSLGNAPSIREYMDQDADGAAVLRMLCLMKPYAEHLDFSDGLLAQARARLRRLRAALAAAAEGMAAELDRAADAPTDADRQLVEHIHAGTAQAHAALRTDFDTGPLLAFLAEVASRLQPDTHPVALQAAHRALAQETAAVGLELVKDDPQLLPELLAFRARVRQAALAGPAAADLLALCDGLRARLQARGLPVQDSVRDDSDSL